MKNTFIKSLVFLTIFIVSCKKEEQNKEPQAASYLLFSSPDDSLVGKIDLKNSNAISDFAKGIKSGMLNGQIGLALNNNTGEVYVSLQRPNGPIYKIASNGIATIIYNGPAANSPGGIAYSASNNKIYWINHEDEKAYSINADGTGSPTALFNGANVNAKGYGLQLDEQNGKLYYANFKKIYKGNLDGTGTPTILYDYRVDTLDAPSNIVLDVANNRIYWTDEDVNVVASANLDGTGDFKILYNNAIHGVDRSDGLAIDFITKKIYWTETGDTYRIRVGNLDGTGTPVTLLSDVESYGLLLK